MSGSAIALIAMLSIWDCLSRADDLVSFCRPPQRSYRFLGISRHNGNPLPPGQRSDFVHASHLSSVAHALAGSAKWGVLALQIARSSLLDRSALAQLLEP